MTTRARTRRRVLSWTTWLSLGVGLSFALGACAPVGEDAAQGLGTSESAADPMSDGAENVRLVGYNDLQGRQALQLTARSDAANGNWLYVGQAERPAEQRRSAAESDHRADGNQRDVTHRHHGPSQSNHGLAHSRSFKIQPPLGVGGVRLHARFE